MSSQAPTRLEEFDARLVQAPLQGLLRNMDGEMSRRLKTAMSSGDVEAERRFSLLLLMLRFTRNSYEAISLLCSDAEDSTKRKKEFALVMPPTNRQLLDLLFTLIFIMDDFPKRSMDYERGGYRQAREEYDKFHQKFGAHSKWQPYFLTLQDSLLTMEKYLSISPAEKADPTKINYWRAPYRLMKQPTKSKAFMEYLEKWLYGETSAQAHLNAGGLLAVGGFFLSDLAPQSELTALKNNLEGYKFRHFTRTLTTVLGIASEIEAFLGLGNVQTLTLVWGLLGGYSEEAAEVYKERYQEMLK